MHCSHMSFSIIQPHLRSFYVHFPRFINRTMSNSLNGDAFELNSSDQNASQDRVASLTPHTTQNRRGVGRSSCARILRNCNLGFWVLRIGLERWAMYAYFALNDDIDVPAETLPNPSGFTASSPAHWQDMWILLSDLQRRCRRAACYLLSPSVLYKRQISSLGNIKAGLDRTDRTSFLPMLINRETVKPRPPKLRLEQMVLIGCEAPG